MLGEIIKSTEALRFHAKSAEIAGQNLAHINDENYARQRVLAREGLMYKGQGGLNTASLDAGGLEHARNELLDKRVFTEFAESSNLETQKEILSLLQAALGESIDRQALAGGLDIDSESNLAAGGLARAIDDLFNAFQELSASPDEATAKEEIVNKVKTLTKRFNDAGEAIDRIDTDLTTLMEDSVKSVNGLLEQLYEVNLQIKRFELLDQGKAVTYRDQRQSLLEDLSKFMDFKLEPEVNDGRETGFWNILAPASRNTDMYLMSSTNGVAEVTKDYGGIINLNNENGDNAQVRAKITSDGKLGHLEVIDGGSQYDDTKGPVLFAMLPPESPVVLDGNQGIAVEAQLAGSVFSQDGKFYQALTDTMAGADLSDENSFLEILNPPVNGQVFPETLRKYSDLESFSKGDQVYYEGKLYQAIEDFGVSRDISVDTANILQKKLSKGEIVEFDDKFFQVLETKSVGTQINIDELKAANFGDELNGFIALGNTPPQKIDEISYVPSSIDNTRPDRWFLTKSYQEGDYIKFGENYFQFTQDTFRDTELDNLARSMQALPYDQTKAYKAGDFIELEGMYYEFTEDFAPFADTNLITENLASTEPFGQGGRLFDGVLQQVDNPNRFYLENNGSYKIADAFREFQLSEISGSEQTKQFRISDITGDVEDNFNFEIQIGEQKVIFDSEGDATAPSFSITGFNESFSEDLKSKLLQIEENGSVVDGTPAINPAFDIIIDEATGDLLISGVAGLGDFTISAVPVDNNQEGADPVVPSLTVANERDYLADKYSIIFTSDDFEEQTIDVSYIGDDAQTASAIADAISNNEVISPYISAFVMGENVVFRAKEQDFEFSVDLGEIQDLHNDNNNQIKISTENPSVPSVSQPALANEGKPAVVEIKSLSDINAVQSYNMSFPEESDFSQPFAFDITLADTPIPVLIEGSDEERTRAQLLFEIEQKILEIEEDGSFVSGTEASKPAFAIESDPENGSIEISGVQNIGSFSLNTLPSVDLSPTISETSETFRIFLVGDNESDLGSLEVMWQGSAEETAQSIKDTIENDALLKDLVSVVKEEGSSVLTLTGAIEQEDAFGNLSSVITNFESMRWTYPKGGAFSQFSADLIQSFDKPINQIDKISGLGGVEQTKIANLNFLPGLTGEASTFSVIVNNQSIELELPADIDPLNPDRFNQVVNTLKSINKDGSVSEDNLATTDPAFDAIFDEASLSIILSGLVNTGDFQIQNDAELNLETEVVQEFLSDDFILTLTDQDGIEFGSITVPQETSTKQNVDAIVSAINNDENLSQLVVASVSLDDEVIITGKEPSFSFITNVSARDNLNAFTVTELSELGQVDISYLESSGAKISRIERSGIDTIGAEIEKVQSIDFKRGEEPMSFRQNEIYYYANQDGGFTHFVVTAQTPEIDPATFDPLDPIWENHFKIFKPQLLDAEDPSLILRKAFPVGHNLDNASLVELNVGLAEAVVKKGEITGFNILNSGNGLPSSDALFAGGMELDFESGSIKGIQDSRSIHLEKFRNDLNDLVSTFVEEINSVYNPEDQPGSYMFGFDAVLTRPVAGRNLLLEEEYELAGREGDASITLYRDEVDMTLPHSQTESFSIVNTTPVFPEEFQGQTFYARGGDNAETIFRGDDGGEMFSFYASASRMQNVTMENDDAYPGEDLANGTADDGRSLMMAYETIPFRIEGLEEGAKLPVIGDNFTFSALPSNSWNLATSLKVDHRFNSDSLLSGNIGVSGSNEIALAIAEMGDETYTNKVAQLNANIGHNISDLNDNIDHQKSIETLLLDQRRAVSSVSIDEEVADLMRFQRSFQASSRVLTTLDKMLEIVVMGLIR
jgi:flagellar hook-associated protein FlgK